MARSAYLVAVYATDAGARAAADVARAHGAAPSDVHIGAADARAAARAGEMREETEHTWLGPGNVGPWTKEMSEGMVIGAVVGAIVGLVLALPFAAIGFGGWPLWLRLLIVGLAGVLAGGTAGWVLGGGFGARRSEEPLAVERGVTVAVPDLPGLADALEGTSPLRIDRVDAVGRPLGTVTSEGDESVMHRLGRNAAEESERG